MRLREIVTGTPEEQRVMQTAVNVRSRLSTGSKPSLAQARTLESADQISRRVFLRRAGVAGLGFVVATALPAGILIQDALKGESDPAFESAYNRYLGGFEKVARGDAEAQGYLRFFKERRKQGKFEDGIVIAMESGDSKANFYTAIVDPNKHKADFRNLPGFAVFRTSTEPTTLFLKNVPITPIWAGTLLAHESTHIYQWLNGIEQARPGGFIQGEIDAYNLEFSVLHRLTDGRFRQALSEVAMGFDLTDDSGNRGFIGGLDPEEFEYVDGAFAESMSDDEKQLRMGAYIIGANFISIEDNSASLEEEIVGKTRFTEMLMSGGIGALPSCTPERCIA